MTRSLRPAGRPQSKETALPGSLQLSSHVSQGESSGEAPGEHHYHWQLSAAVGDGASEITVYLYCMYCISPLSPRAASLTTLSAGAPASLQLHSVARTACRIMSFLRCSIRHSESKATGKYVVSMRAVAR